MEFKSIDALQALVEKSLEQKSINKTNPKGIAHANSLIESGDVKEPSTWEHPTASEENAYLEANGWDKFAQWYLGVDTNADPETKAHYGYVYTSDFKTVDRQGLRAIRQRAAQNNQTAIFAAAGKMIEKIDAKKNG
ncbi:MAG: hypothetical protein RLZZ196_3366 [Bacteroidota bacterium]|jgi:hypothetical protein